MPPRRRTPKNDKKSNDSPARPNKRQKTGKSSGKRNIASDKNTPAANNDAEEVINAIFEAGTSTEQSSAAINQAAGLFQGPPRSTVNPDHTSTDSWEEQSRRMFNRNWGLGESVEKERRQAAEQQMGLWTEWARPKLDDYHWKYVNDKLEVWKAWADELVEECGNAPFVESMVYYLGLSVFAAILIAVTWSARIKDMLREDRAAQAAEQTNKMNEEAAAGEISTAAVENTRLVDMNAAEDDFFGDIGE